MTLDVYVDQSGEGLYTAQESMNELLYGVSEISFGYPEDS